METDTYVDILPPVVDRAAGVLGPLFLPHRRVISHCTSNMWFWAETKSLSFKQQKVQAGS